MGVKYCSGQQRDHREKNKNLRIRRRIQTLHELYTGASSKKVYTGQQQHISLANSLPLPPFLFYSLNIYYIYNFFRERQKVLKQLQTVLLFASSRLSLQMQVRRNKRKKSALPHRFLWSSVWRIRLCFKSIQRQMLQKVSQLSQHYKQWDKVDLSFRREDQRQRVSEAAAAPTIGWQQRQSRQWWLFLLQNFRNIQHQFCSWLHKKVLLVMSWLWLESFYITDL